MNRTFGKFIAVMVMRNAAMCLVALSAAGCALPSTVTQTQQPHYVSRKVDIGGPDWSLQRPLVDEFARGGPYQSVDVVAPSDTDAQLVQGWLRADGIGTVKATGSGHANLIKLTGYY